MMRWVRLLGLAALAAGGVLAASAIAPAQTPTPEPGAAPRTTVPAPSAAPVKAVPPSKRKADIPTIRWNLEGMLEHSRAGRSYLAQPASVETFEAARKEIYKAYVQVRDAHAGVLMRLGRHEKNQDPLLTQYEKKIQHARSQLLVAMDQANNGARLKQFRRAARGLEFLDKAMRNVQFVLAVMP